MSRHGEIVHILMSQSRFTNLAWSGQNLYKASRLMQPLP